MREEESGELEEVNGGVGERTAELECESASIHGVLLTSEGISVHFNNNCAKVSLSAFHEIIVE